MSILCVNLDKVNLDDDKNFPKMIPKLFFMSPLAWCNKFEKRKAFKNMYKQRINTCSVASNKMVGLVVVRREEKKKWMQFLLIKLGGIKS